MPHPRHVCVIDDDASFRAAMASFLRSLGHRVEDFASAEAFLAAGGAARFSCILCDVELPGQSGLALQETLAGQGNRVPLVLISGHDDADLHARARAGGALCLLPKPCPADAVIACLEAAFGGR